jgi:Fur family ferric uptake transcriptional regulator
MASPSKNKRRTNQRAAIIKVMSEATSPLTTVEIHERTLAMAPGIGIATVYRAVKELTAQGWLSAVEIAGDRSRYERADKPHHHHFHCRACGRVFDVHACPGNLKGLVPPGFKMESHEIILRGLCAECLPK